MVATVSKNIQWGPVGKTVYERTYSRTKPDGSKETWEETVARVVDGNLSLVDKKFWRRNERQDLFNLFYNFEALPAGRHLWVSGVKGRQFLFNCHVAGWRDTMSDHYSFVFDELMKGGGIGANYSDRYIKKYPAIKNVLDVHIVCDPEHADYEALKDNLSSDYSYEWTGCIPVDDSREGWVEALVLLIDQAFSRNPQPIVFDVSRIRPYGAPIRSFGGTASGPGALVRMLIEIADLLNSCVGKKLTSLDHMEMDHRIAMCVVAGNVRRSARISIKHWKDPDIFDFITCKNDDARVAHWTTNISVEVDNAFFREFKKKDPHACLLYETCIKSMHKSGEPGFVNMSLAQHGEIEEVVSCNPCGEVFLLPFENCNLGHVNLGKFYDNLDGAKKAFMMMTRFLIRATFGDIYSPWQKDVSNRNRRIGVGFFGFQNWLCLQGKKYSECHNDQEVQQNLRLFYREVKRTAMEYAHQLRIPAPIKNTALAPTGTIAKLDGSTEGAQALIFLYYEQRIRHQKDDPNIPQLMMDGVEFEECINKQEAVNTVIAKHICKHPLVDAVAALGYNADEIVEGQNDVSIHDTLAIQAMLQREYADNSISLTVNLTPAITEEELFHTMIKFLPKLKGTTVMVGAGGRAQPPYTEISRIEYDAYEGRKIIMDTKSQCSNNVCPIK